MNAEAEGSRVRQARQRALQRTAWLLTGDSAVAEDLVQTALVRSSPRWERIRRRDNPEIYVRRAMMNTARAGAPPVVGRTALRPCPTARRRGVATAVAMRLAVQSALRSLTARQRAVLVLRVLDDLSRRRSRRCLTARSDGYEHDGARAGQAARGPSANWVDGSGGPVNGMDRPLHDLQSPSASHRTG